MKVRSLGSHLFPLVKEGFQGLKIPSHCRKSCQLNLAMATSYDSMKSKENLQQRKSLGIQDRSEVSCSVSFTKMFSFLKGAPKTFMVIYKFNSFCTLVLYYIFELEIYQVVFLFSPLSLEVLQVKCGQERQPAMKNTLSP